MINNNILKYNTNNNNNNNYNVDNNNNISNNNTNNNNRYYINNNNINNHNHNKNSDIRYQYTKHFFLHRSVKEDFEDSKMQNLSPADIRMKIEERQNVILFLIYTFATS